MSRIFVYDKQNLIGSSSHGCILQTVQTHNTQRGLLIIPSAKSQFSWKCVCVRMRVLKSIAIEPALVLRVEVAMLSVEMLKLKDVKASRQE